MAQHFFFFLSKIYVCPYFRPSLSLSCTISVASSSGCQPICLPVTLHLFFPLLWGVLPSASLCFLTGCAGCFPGFSQATSQPHLPPFYSHRRQTSPPNGTSLSSPEHITLLQFCPFVDIGPSARPCSPGHVTSQWLLPSPKKPAKMPPSSSHLPNHPEPVSFFLLEQHLNNCVVRTAWSSSAYLEGIAPYLTEVLGKQGPCLIGLFHSIKYLVTQNMVYLSLERAQAWSGSASSWPVVCGFLTSCRKDSITPVRLLKLGTVQHREGLGQKKRQESPGGPLLRLPRIIGKKRAKVRLLLHLEVTVTMKKGELKQDCFKLPEKSL